MIAAKPLRPSRAGVMQQGHNAHPMPACRLGKIA